MKAKLDNLELQSKITINNSKKKVLEIGVNFNKF